MHNPPHPGGIVKRQCLEPLGLTVTRAAAGLGVTRQALSELVNERTGISVEMAIRLSKAFGSTARDLARDADGLGSLAGPRPRRADRGGEFRGGVTGAPEGVRFPQPRPAPVSPGANPVLCNEAGRHCGPGQ